MFRCLVFVALFCCAFAAVDEPITMHAVAMDQIDVVHQKYYSDNVTVTLAAAKDKEMKSIDLTTLNFNSTDGLKLHVLAISPAGQTIDVTMTYSSDAQQDVTNIHEYIDSEFWYQGMDDELNDVQGCDLENKKVYILFDSDDFNDESVTVTFVATMETATDDWLCSSDILEHLKKVLGGLFIFLIICSVTCGICLIGGIAMCVFGTGWVCCLACCKKDDNNPKAPLLKERV